MEKRRLRQTPPPPRRPPDVSLSFRFLERRSSSTSRGTRTPPPQSRATEPTSPSQLLPLFSHTFPDSPWEKVASPPPHRPQGSDAAPSVHIKVNAAPFNAAGGNGGRRLQKKERCGSVQMGFESEVRGQRTRELVWNKV